MLIIIFHILGSESPAAKFLNKHVVTVIAPHWYKIGIELMRIEDEGTLKTMNYQYSSDMIKGAERMLELWVDRQPKASWYQLIAALREPHIGLVAKANQIENMLMPEGMKLTTTHMVVYMYIINIKY